MPAHPVSARARQIAARLQELSRDDFQVFCIRAMRVRYEPSTIVSMALNRDGSAGKGHPDGALAAGNDRIHVEVSTDKDWSGKIKSDLPKLKEWYAVVDQRPNRLIFITARHTNALTAEAAAEFSLSTRELCAEAEMITGTSVEIVHAAELAEELSTPKYSQLVASFLEIGLEPAPYNTVRYELETSHRAKSQAERWLIDCEAYYDGRLRFPSHLIHKAREILSATTKTLTILGASASGKTTLALLLGAEVEKRDALALYVDLGRRHVGVRELIDTLQKLADDRTLVIFDNIHLYDRVEFAVLKQELLDRRDQGWLRRFQVIFIGRGKPDDVARSLVIQPDKELFECVFQRFAAQHDVVPDDAMRRAWCDAPEAFGCDLVVFWFALASNSTALNRGPSDWQSVYQFVYQTFLAPYPSRTREAVLRLCVLAEHGLSVPGEDLDADARQVLLERGFDTHGREVPSVVSRGLVTSGASTKEEYQLYHPSFARLLLRGSSSQFDALAELKRWLQRKESIWTSVATSIWRESKRSAEEDDARLRVVIGVLAEKSELVSQTILHDPTSRWASLIPYMKKAEPARAEIFESALDAVFGTDLAEDYRSFLDSRTATQLLAYLREPLLAGKLATLLNDYVSNRDRVREMVMQNRIIDVLKLLGALRRIRSTATIATKAVVQLELVRYVTSNSFQPSIEDAIILFRYAGQYKGRVAKEIRSALIPKIRHLDLRPLIDRTPLSVFAELILYASRSGAAAREIVKNAGEALSTKEASGALASLPLHHAIRELTALDDISPRHGVFLRRKLQAEQLCNMVQKAAPQNVAGAVRYVRGLTDSRDLSFVIAFRHALLHLDTKQASATANTLSFVLRELLASGWPEARELIRQIAMRISDNDLRHFAASGHPEHLTTLLTVLDKVSKLETVGGDVGRRLRPMVDTDILQALMSKATWAELSGMVAAITEQEGFWKTAGADGDATENATEAAAMASRLRDASRLPVLQTRFRKALSQPYLDSAAAAFVQHLWIFDRAAWKGLIEEAAMESTFQRMIAQVQQRRSFTDVTSLIELFRDLELRHRQRQLIEAAVEEPVELAKVAAQGGLHGVATFCHFAKTDPSDKLAEFVKVVAAKVDLQKWYRSDVDVIVFLLWNLSCAGGKDSYKAWWHPYLQILAKAELEGWPNRENRKAALMHALSLWGVIAEFPQFQTTPDELMELQSRFRVPFVENILLDPHLERFTLTTVLGLKALSVRIGIQTGREVWKRFEERQRVQFTNPRMSIAVEKTRQWLLRNDPGDAMASRHYGRPRVRRRFK